MWINCKPFYFLHVVVSTFAEQMRRLLALTLFLILAGESYSQWVFVSNGSWKSNRTWVQGWNLPGFDDSSWGNSTSPSPNPFPGFPVVPGSQSMWVSPYSDSAFFRKEFELRSNCVQASLFSISCDNEYFLYVNGVAVAHGRNASINMHNIQPHLRIGPNVIAVLAIDWGPPYLVSFKVSIDYTSGPEIDLGVDQFVCQGDSTYFTTNHNYSGYDWSHGFKTRKAPAWKQGKYWCTALDSNGCLWVDTVKLTEYTHNFVDLGEDTALCTGDKAILDPGSYDKYEWSTGDTTSTITVGYAGSFGVKVTDGNGCSSEDSKSIIYFDNATVNLGEDTTLCKGDSLSISASFPFSTYEWDDGSSDTSFLVTKPGTYSITITNYCGTVSDDITVDYIDDVTMSLGEDDFFCFADRYRLEPTAIGAQVYEWTTGDSTSYIYVEEPGTYGVTVYDFCGNSGYDEVELTAGINQKNMIPNSFTPNRDGKNETWRTFIRPSGEFNLVVVDRWGKQVFQSSDPTEEWDGTWEGQPLPAANYLYRVEFVNCQNQKEISNGLVTIVR